MAKTSLEQWGILASVVDAGGFAQAATALNKSQSAVSYGVARLQEALDVPLLEVDGRRAVLTAHGKTLLKRARPGTTYILAGTVLEGSVRHVGSALLFRVRDPKLNVSVPVRYTGEIPDPFAAGRGVLVDVKKGGPTGFVGEPNTLTTKCPSKYQAASSSY